MNKTDFIAHIRSFTGIQDTEAQPDDTIMGWAFMAESEISQSLRIADMIQIDTATLDAGSRVPFPTDYIAADFVRNLTADIPVVWKPRFEFYNMSSSDRSNLFTQSGNFVEFGGDVAGNQIELVYFGDCPHLADDETWLSGRFNSLLTAATLAIAGMAMEETAKASAWQSDAASQISVLNDRYQRSIASGSKLTRSMRSFG